SSKKAEPAFKPVRPARIVSRRARRGRSAEHFLAGVMQHFRTVAVHVGKVALGQAVDLVDKLVVAPALRAAVARALDKAFKDHGGFLSVPLAARLFLPDRYAS